MTGIPEPTPATRALRVVIGSLDVGGTENQLLALLPRLARRGWRPRVLALTEAGPIADALLAAGIEVQVLASGAWRALPRSPLRRLLGTPQVLLALVRDLRARPADLTLVLLPQAYLVAGLARVLAGSRAPWVMSRRSLNRYQARHRLLARAERWLHRRVDAFVANSEAVAAELRAEGAPADRVRVIRNGVALPPAVDCPPRDAVRARLGLRADELVVVCVANLIAYKGHQDLLRALARIPADAPRARLLCVGSGAYGAVLREEAARLGVDGQVLWLGLRNDVPALLCAADLAVLASHEEGFSNAVLEYMAAGLPVVATEVGGNGEAVVDGVTGILVPPRDPAALASALERLIRDPEIRARMGAQGRARVRAEFDLDRCVVRLDELLGQLR